MNHPMLKGRLNIVNGTLALSAVLLILCLFQATTETNYTLTACVLLAAVGLAVVLLFIHLQRSLFLAGQRLKHLALVGLIALIVLGLLPVCVNRHPFVLRRAFLEKRLPAYEAMVAKVLEHRANLTERYSQMDRVAQRSGVYAWTNKDGTVTVRFYGYVNGGSLDYTRTAGYLYHSGPMLPKPGDTNYYLLPEETILSYPRYHLRLTNNWYEY
jgi:hypothetical protein